MKVLAKYRKINIIYNNYYRGNSYNYDYRLHTQNEEKEL